MLSADPSDWIAAARRYLAAELRERAPTDLMLAAVFDERPLEGEGRTALFHFELPMTAGSYAGAGPADPRHYVAVGETEPGYYPAYGLSADDAYSLHIGTRFALVVGLGVLPPEREPPGARAALGLILESCNPGVPHSERLAGLFQSGDEVFAVYRVTLSDRTVYGFGGDCPPGFDERVELPPVVALRLHLGRLIRAEARAAAAAGRSG